MLVVAMCFDKPGHKDLRQKTRAEHLTWVQAGTIDLKYGGPLLADDGETSIGSLIIANVEGLAAARALFAEDPYNKAGLFERVVVMPTRQVLPIA
jgi:uncharacterized protein YciI